MRSFLSRFVSPVTRVVLVAPCLLICSACVTFPVDKLEVGMTTTQATEAFGEPSSTSIGELHQAVELLRSKVRASVGVSETRGPVELKLEESSTQALGSLETFVAELDEASGEQGVRSTWIYPYNNFMLGNMEVELFFAGNKLTRWETRRLPSTGTGYQATFPSTSFDHSIHHYPSKKDTQHHKKGHKHHHDC